MTTLNDNELKFLSNRRKLLKIFPIAGGIGGMLVFAYVPWLFYRTPLLINPNVIKTKIAENTIESSTLTLMSLLLPWAMLGLILMALALLGFAFSWHVLERKYLKIIDRLKPE